MSLVYIVLCGGSDQRPSDTATKMNIRTHAPLLSASLFGFCASAQGAENEASTAAPFSTASVHFEQNASDGDGEVVFKAKAGKDGLAELIVRSPDGRPVVTFKAPDTSTLGMRQFHFETPEPRDLNVLRAAYPEGVYEFSGVTFSGAKLAGKASLSHRLPALAMFVTPASAAENVPVKNFVVSWSAVEDVASYIVKVHQRELNVDFTTSLPAAWRAFAFPDGFLSRGKQYKMAIGTVTREGNVSYVESTFTTEK
jgi:hypothetical protein